MIDPTLLADLQRQINAADLSSHADAILATAQTAVDLILDGPSSGTLGETRFGGTPDLPTNMDWPRNDDDEALTFLAQINLSEIPPFDDNPLPTRGWLFIFIGLDEPASDVENLLFLVDGDAQLVATKAPTQTEWANDENYIDGPAQKLRLALFADIPRWATQDFTNLIQAIEPDEDEADDVGDALNDLGSNSHDAKSIGQLLGHARGIGHDSREDALVVREIGPQYIYDYAHRKALDMTRAGNWLNLLCLESFREGDLDFCVWDAGYFNFLVHRDDLKKLDFTRVYAAVETS